MLLTFGLPTLSSPYQRHIRPHVIPILLPLSQVGLYLCLSVSVCVCKYVCLCVSLSLSLSVGQYVCLFVSMSFCLSGYLSLYNSVCLKETHLALWWVCMFYTHFCKAEVLFSLGSFP